jgi:hypothetical protein
MKVYVEAGHGCLYIQGSGIARVWKPVGRMAGVKSMIYNKLVRYDQVLLPRSGIIPHSLAELQEDISHALPRPHALLSIFATERLAEA